MINVYQKLLSKCLSTRLKGFLPKLIHINKTGYVKDRQINDTFLTISDIIEYLQIHKLPGVLIAVDFEKVFDTLLWDFIYKTLETI